MLKAFRSLLKGNKEKEDKKKEKLYKELITYTEMIFTQIQDPSVKIIFFPRELHLQTEDLRSLNAKLIKNLNNKVEITGRLTNESDFYLNIHCDSIQDCYYALFYTSKKPGEIKFHGKYFLF